MEMEREIQERRRQEVQNAKGLNFTYVLVIGEFLQSPKRCLLLGFNPEIIEKCEAGVKGVCLWEILVSP